MKRFYQFACLFLVSIFFFHCQKDVGFIGGPDAGTPNIVNPDPIKANLQGNIVDENGQPAVGVTITAGAQSVITNATGYFRITDASLDKNASVVIAEKAGYFKGYRVFSATSGTNQVLIKLIKRNLAGTITASSGGSATLSNGAKISLPANSVVVASSSSDYSGDVKVYAAYIDPTATDIDDLVPGSFAANSLAGNRMALSSFGMLAVELESASGEKLQIKSNSAATLTTPIPAASLSGAPATIPLWYVDEQTGVWKEEGTATKQGNNYVGDVKHFSYWNCDLPYPGVYLSATVQNNDGLPLVHVQVKVSIPDVNGSAHGFTDSLGQVKGLVPSNKNLVLKVLDLCGNIIYSQNLSPISQNTDLGVIKITSASPSLVTLKGTLLDCNGSPVKNGYAIVNTSNFIRYANTNALGQFSTTFVTCSGTAATARIIGVDQTSQQQSQPISAAITSPLTNTGNITTCGTSSSEYINYTVDGINYSVTSIGYDSVSIGSTVTGNIKTTYIQGSKFPSHVELSVDNVTAAGTFPVKTLTVQSYKAVTLTQPFNIIFTHYPAAAGEFYEGTFTGKFTADSQPTVHNISATFRIRRS